MKKKNQLRNAEIRIFDVCIILLKLIKQLENDSRKTKSQIYRPISVSSFEIFRDLTVEVGMNILNNGYDIDPDSEQDQARIQELAKRSEAYVDNRMKAQELEDISISVL